MVFNLLLLASKRHRLEVARPQSFSVFPDPKSLEVALNRSTLKRHISLVVGLFLFFSFSQGNLLTTLPPPPGKEQNRWFGRVLKIGTYFTAR